MPAGSRQKRSEVGGQRSASRLSLSRNTASATQEVSRHIPRGYSDPMPPCRCPTNHPGLSSAALPNSPPAPDTPSASGPCLLCCLRPCQLGLRRVFPGSLEFSPRSVPSLQSPSSAAAFLNRCQSGSRGIRSAGWSRRQPAPTEYRRTIQPSLIQRSVFVSFLSFHFSAICQCGNKVRAGPPCS